MVIITAFQAEDDSSILLSRSRFKFEVLCEKIKNECLDGMDFERILEIYNLYIDANQPCDFHKLASIRQ